MPGIVKNDIMCRKSSGGMRGEGGMGDVPMVETWRVDDTVVGSRYLEGRSGDAGDCRDLKECTSMAGEVIIESEDCICNPGAVGMSVMAMVERSNKLVNV